MEFGCVHCVPEQAARPRDLVLDQVAVLVEESHFRVSVTACRSCGQRFARIFTERIDWVGGEDAMTTTLLPLSAPEADQAIAAGEDVDLSWIQRLGGERRYLCDEWPSGAPRRVAYERGAVIPPYD